MNNGKIDKFSEIFWSFLEKYLRRYQIYMTELFCKNRSWVSAVNHFCKKAHIFEEGNLLSNVQVGWSSNNHGGGFVRISSVLENQHQHESIALRNVLKFVCYGHNTRAGRTRFGDCQHPCDARGGCDYPTGTFYHAKVIHHADIFL